MTDTKYSDSSAVEETEKALSEVPICSPGHDDTYSIGQVGVFMARATAKMNELHQELERCDSQIQELSDLRDKYGDQMEELRGILADWMLLAKKF